MAFWASKWGSKKINILIKNLNQKISFLIYTNKNLVQIGDEIFIIMIETKLDLNGQLSNLNKNKQCI
jgi:hypothetical protein